MRSALIMEEEEEHFLTYFQKFSAYFLDLGQKTAGFKRFWKNFKKKQNLLKQKISVSYARTILLLCICG